MMTTAEKIKMYTDKKNFVEGIAKAFIQVPKGHTVENVTYELYKKEINETTTYYYEWVIVHFRGGAISPVTANGNSNLANFQVISSLINGGYYDEVSYYNAMQDKFERVSLEVTDNAENA